MANQLKGRRYKFPRWIPKSPRAKNGGQNHPLVAGAFPWKMLPASLRESRIANLGEKKMKKTHFIGGKEVLKMLLSSSGKVFSIEGVSPLEI